MATTDIQNSVYKTIDVIVNKRLEDLKADKTIDCIIDSCLDERLGKYRIKYGSGFFDAYSHNTDDVYLPRTPVHVLIPESDFNKKKTIIGRTSAGINLNSETVSSHGDSYNFLGKNLLSAEKENFSLAGCSGNSVFKILYDKTEENSSLQLDQKSLQVYLEDAEGFYFSGDFRTDYTNKQIMSENGDYYLQFDITMKHGDGSYSTLEQRWEDQAQLISINIDEEDKSLDSYKISIDELFNNSNIVSVKDLQKQLNQQLTNLQIFSSNIDVTTADPGAVELMNLYIQWISELVSFDKNVNGYPVGISDLKQQYDNWFKQPLYDYEQESYTVLLNTEKMSGNVFAKSLDVYTTQSMTIDINPATFVSIDKIIFGTKNLQDLDSNGNDTFVRNINLQCIKYKQQDNKDYQVNIKHNGQTYLAAEQDTVETLVELLNNSGNNLINQARILWFKKNDNITSLSDGYNSYGGEGWEHLTFSTDTMPFYDRIASMSTTFKENKNYKNQYKVVVVYEDFVETQEFNIYNVAHKYNIQLISNLGNSFKTNDQSNRIITFQVDNKNDSFEDCNFKWTIQLEDGPVYTILPDNEVNENIPGYDVLQYVRWYLPFADDKRQYEITIDYRLFSKKKNIIITCEAESSTVRYGKAELILVYKEQNYTGYTIDIINGNQVFLYDENGLSPASAQHETPQEILSLNCNFYDALGNLIDPLDYTVAWVPPMTGTLIQTSSTLLSENEKVNSDTYDFSIAEQYNHNYSNNQVICEVTYEGETYGEWTNFFFGKTGDNGTNGSDVVAQIDTITSENPKAEQILLSEWLTLNVDKTGDNESYIWNNGQEINDPILKLQLFKNNELVDPEEYRLVSWDVLNNGLSSKYLDLQRTVNLNEGIIEYNPERISTSRYTNYIVEGQASLPIDEDNNQAYKAYYPICMKIKHAEVDYNVGIDRTRTLREVVYDADGRNPQYARSLGVGLNFKVDNDTIDEERIIVWEPHGGVIDGNFSEETPSFSIEKDKTIIPCIQGVEPINNFVAQLEAQRDQQVDVTKNIQKNNYKRDINSSIASLIDDIESQIADVEKQITAIENEINSQKGVDGLDSSVPEEYLKAKYYDLYKEIDQFNKNKEDWERDLSVLEQTISNDNWNTINNFLFEDEYSWPESVPEQLQEIVITWKNKYAQEIAAIKAPYNYKIDYLQGNLSAEENPSFCSIVPNDVYNGEYPNQYVRALVYNDTILEYELIIPFYMHLNNYSVSSVNNWTEDADILLSPQAHIGEKHIEDNSFTGISSGVFGQYADDGANKVHGLFGFNHGQQSISLDVETGNASFGLPEVDDEDVSNALTEGRINLRPGGISNIAKWNFDSRNMYKIASEEETALLGTSELHKCNRLPIDEKLVAAYDDAPQYASASIPHTEQGILFSGLPVYASFKGRPLTAEDHTNRKINYLDLNTTVREGDSFELQIDPNDTQFFELYEHSSKVPYGKCIVNDEYKIIQQYYNSSGELKERPLSQLVWDSGVFGSGTPHWNYLNKVIGNAYGKEIDEWVIGTCSQYRDQKQGTLNLVWNFITVNDNEVEVPINYQFNEEKTQIISLTISDETKVNKVWRRTKKAGITTTGKFAAEAISAGSIGMNFGNISAFGGNSNFVGGSLDFENNPIIQFFVDEKQNNTTDPVYISSTKTNENEGLRPIKLYAGGAETSGIFVSPNPSKNGDSINISKVELKQGNSNYVKLFTARGNNKSELILNSDSNVTSGLTHIGKWKTNITSTFTQETGAANVTVNGNKTETITGSYILKAANANSSISADSTSTKLANSNNKLVLKNYSEYATANQIWIRGGGASSQVNTGNYATIIDAENNDGLVLRASAGKLPAGAPSMAPQSGDLALILRPTSSGYNNTQFSLTAGLANGSAARIWNEGSTVNVSNGLYVSGNIKATNNITASGDVTAVNFHGNGNDVTYTVNSSSETCDPSFSGGGSIGSSSVTVTLNNVPKITIDDNKRPTIKKDSASFSIGISSSYWATHDWVTSQDYATESWVNNNYAPKASSGYIEKGFSQSTIGVSGCPPEYDAGVLDNKFTVLVTAINNIINHLK